MNIKSTINSRIINISLIITGVMSFLLNIFPEIDLRFSSLFFSSENGFVYKKQFLVYQIYLLLPYITKLFVSLSIMYLIYICFKYRMLNKVIRSGIFFLCISAAIGPGIIVNGILKENFGRARPSQIKFFNGEKEFTPAFKISDQCDTNCSLSSGHAAMAFFFSAIAYLSAKNFNKIYLASLLFGSLVGLSRIIMGGHFLSDVIISAFIVLLINHIIYFLWKKSVKFLEE